MWPSGYNTSLWKYISKKLVWLVFIPLSSWRWNEDSSTKRWNAFKRRIQMETGCV